MRKRVPAPILLLAFAALVMAGCGKNEDPVTTGAAPARSPETKRKPDRSQPRASLTVTKAQIAAASPGTAERTVLEWWRDVQINDPEHARDLYIEPPTLPNLAGQFNFVAGLLKGSIEVVSATQEGNRAVAEVRWTRPGGAERDVTLRLEEVDGEWALLDTRFLDEMVEDLQADGA